ncbi:MAG: IS4 family transposase [Sphingobacteriaceae bacterium]|nr:IS4 family transposase [Sphingobacteriaceae bacterium]
MAKNSFFSGTTVFGQLIKLIPDSILGKVVEQTCSDRYSKGFKTYDHLLSMLFATLAHCTSLREIEAAFASMQGKGENSKVDFRPKRSTLSDANRKRSSTVFEALYQALFDHYRPFITDSQLRSDESRSIYVIDSTTISLFQAILENAGRKPKTGKAKGGIKVHTVLKLEDVVPMLIWMSKASAHDSPYLSKLKPEAGSIYLFDRGYIDYKAYDAIVKAGAFFVTRLKENSVFDIIDEAFEPGSNIMRDVTIKFPRKAKGEIFTDEMYRLVEIKSEKDETPIRLLTNIQHLNPTQIGDLYRKRWQIELLFKQLKQNYPLKYFLGDTPNAIEIQIWVALIANLLINVLKKSLNKAMAHSNLATFLRINLLAYIKPTEVLNYLRHTNRKKPKSRQLKLQLSG